MQQVDFETPQLAPAPHHCGPGTKNLGESCPRSGVLPFLSQDLIEEDDFDPASAESIYEDVVLVEEHHRLEPRSIDPQRKIEQRLMRTADGSIFVALYDEYSGGPGPRASAGRFHALSGKTGFAGLPITAQALGFYRLGHSEIWLDGVLRTASKTGCVGAGRVGLQRRGRDGAGLWRLSRN